MRLGFCTLGKHRKEEILADVIHKKEGKKMIIVEEIKMNQLEAGRKTGSN